MLRDPAAISRLNEEAQAQAMVLASQRMQAHKLASRQRSIDKLEAQMREAVSEQGEAVVAEVHAESAYKESSRVHTIIASSQAAEEAMNKRHLRNIVTNTQLRDIAEQQAAEIQQLHAELRQWQMKNFPSLAAAAAERPASAWAPPDYRPPLPPAPTAPSGSGVGSMPGSAVGSRPSTAAQAIAAARAASRPTTASIRAASGGSASGAGGGLRPTSSSSARTPTKPGSAGLLPAAGSRQGSLNGRQDPAAAAAAAAAAVGRLSGSGAKLSPRLPSATQRP